MDVATEEMGHVEMLATMVARLLEGAPVTATAAMAAADPVVGAVLGGMDPQQVIVAGGGRCWRTATGTRGTAVTSWPAATCWRISMRMSRLRRRAGCRPPGCAT
jgi:Mn-containing catalase